MSDIRIIIMKVPTREYQSLKHYWRVEKPAAKKGEEAEIITQGNTASIGEAVKKARVAAKNYLIATEYGEEEITLEPLA